MKRIFLYTIMGLLIFSLTPCFGEEGAGLYSDGFRNIPWGVDKTELPDLGLSKKALKGIYASGESSVLFMEGKGNLDMKFKQLPLLSIFLRFNNGVFYAVDMVFSEKYHQRISELLILEMGNPDRKSENEQEWISRGVGIRLTDREILVVASIE